MNGNILGESIETLDRIGAQVTQFHLKQCPLFIHL